MRIVLAYTHHPRCIAHYYRRAFQQLGHEVVTVGPWADEWPMGTDGREPNIQLHRFLYSHYLYDMLPLAVRRHDLFILIDSGEKLTIQTIPGKWAHLALEGTSLEWSDTPYKFAGLMQHVKHPEGVTWSPGAFDVEEHLPGPPASERQFDLVQMAIPYESRKFMAVHVPQIAPDLRCKFGEVWGPEYGDTYRNALATWVGSGQDFVTIRVFEAMAMGCLVIADRTPSIAKLFNEDEHFIGYDPLWNQHGEPYPNPTWLVETIRRIRRDGDGGMAARAQALVWSRDSWKHRAQAILDRVAQ